MKMVWLAGLLGSYESRKEPALHNHNLVIFIFFIDTISGAFQNPIPEPEPDGKLPITFPSWPLLHLIFLL